MVFHRLGPLVSSWCMRMEAKNSYFKWIAQLGNFRDIVYSVAKRHQRLMCSYLQSHNFFSTTTECGPGILLIKQLSVDVHIFTDLSVYSCQARRQGGFKGVCLNPCKRFYTHCLTVHFEYPTIWNWSNSLDAIENHRCPNKFVHG